MFVPAPGYIIERFLVENDVLNLDRLVPMFINNKYYI